MNTQENIDDEKKTAQQVKDLKKEWESNPTWDLCTAPGFEDYELHLRAYQKEKEIQWELKKARRTRMAAKSMGLTVDFYKRWKELKGIADAQRSQASKLMLHLVYGTHKVDEEQKVIVDVIIDNLFRGAINYARAEMIQESFSLPKS